jgi:hypothetical protein
LSFSPLYGFGNFEEATINKYIISSATARGKIVVPTESTGTATVGNDYGYFLLEDVTTDGPSYEERHAGLHQWEVIVGSPVAVLIPKNGAIVRTSHVAEFDGSAILSQPVIISDGVYVTDSDATALAIKGIIVQTPTQTGISGVYDIRIVNANGRY